MSEILLILLVALLVIKPQDLPEVARKLGRFVGTIKKFIHKINSEVNEITNSEKNKTQS